MSFRPNSRLKPLARVKSLTVAVTSEPALRPTKYRQPAREADVPRERSTYSQARGTDESHEVRDHTRRTKNKQTSQLKIWEGRYGFDQYGFPYTSQAYRVVRKFGGATRLAFVLREIGEPIPVATIQGWLTPGSLRTPHRGAIPTPAIYSVLRASQADGVLLTPEDLDPRLLPVRDADCAITESWAADARDRLRELQYGNPIIGGPLDSLADISKIRCDISRELFRVHPNQKLAPEPPMKPKKADNNSQD